MSDVIHVHAPKILPWLAHKAGISEQRAEHLWHAALRQTSRRHLEAGSSAYWQATMDHLLHSIAEESLRQDAASLGWRSWSRAQARFWAAPVAAYDALMLPVARYCRLIAAGQLRLG